MKRYQFSSLFLGVVLNAKIAFSERSWPYLAACAVPWLQCAGQRCVTRLAVWGSHRRSLSGYYRFLSDGKWRMTVFFKCLFDLIVRTFRTPDLIPQRDIGSRRLSAFDDKSFHPQGLEGAGHGCASDQEHGQGTGEVLGRI